jgi:hypothetical protein
MMNTQKSISNGAVIGILAAIVAVIGGIFYFTMFRGGGGEEAKPVTRKEEMQASKDYYMNKYQPKPNGTAGNQR